MHVGDRARLLVSRGIDPLAEADLSVSAKFHNRVLAQKLKRARAGFLLFGCCATTLLGAACGFRPMTSFEASELAALSRAGVDADHPLPDDLPIRLAVPRPDVAGIAAVLSPSEEVEPDLNWVGALDGHPGVPVVAPSRLGALHGVVAYLSQIDPQVRPSVLTDLRIVGGLTSTARDLVDALRAVPATELHQLPHVILALMALPQERRQALERAGFPPVPADPARQELYVLVSHAEPDQGALVYRILRDHDRQRALPRLDTLLQSRPARRLLGALADGTYSVPNLPGLSANCDIARPGSCGGAR